MSSRSQALRAVSAVALTLSMLSCTEAPPPEPAAPAAPAGLSDADRAAIQTTLDALTASLNPEDNSAWAATYTEDAIFMAQGTPPLRGRASLRAWGEGPDSEVVLTMTFDDVDIRGGGDIAYVTSTTTATFEGVEEPADGKQLLILQRQADNQWLIVAAHISGH